MKYFADKIIIKLILITLIGLLLMSEECQEPISPIKSAIVAPNPATDKISLIIQLENETQLEIGIYDMNGNLLLKNESLESYSIGENRIEFNLQTFNSGTYLCRIDNENFSETIKFIVNK